ncbi:MAG: tRNA epoxyqueuosine(34) reductase QueG [Deltaproteobacteria bacterium]|nr:tRNA epoxyqueuosine(34) reductase QueG [Deltaproteobacteria bacterium]
MSELEVKPTQRAPTLSDRVRSLAQALGFDRVGICSPQESLETEFLSEWLERGYAGSMTYMAERASERASPEKLMPGVRSIVALALAHPSPESAQGGGDSSTGRGVAGYAGGADYHEVLLDRVKALGIGMQALAGHEVSTRCYVDTGPVLERVYAARAGLGWQGKNTCLIDRELGSRLLLGVVMTDLELDFDVPETDHCGTCRACLDACPTDAFVDAYVLDARRCISYLTIEDRGVTEPGLRNAQGEWIFGCDVCQDVCPWNRKPDQRELPDPLGLRERLRPDPRWVDAELHWVLSLDEAQWREATRGTALRRSGYRGLMRNALVAAGNRKDEQLRPLIQRFAEGQDPLLAEHAHWALAELSSPSPS